MNPKGLANSRIAGYDPRDSVGVLVGQLLLLEIVCVRRIARNWRQREARAARQIRAAAWAVDMIFQRHPQMVG